MTLQHDVHPEGQLKVGKLDLHPSPTLTEEELLELPSVGMRLGMRVAMNEVSELEMSEEDEERQEERGEGDEEVNGAGRRTRLVRSWIPSWRPL